MSGHSKWSTIKRQKGLMDIKRGQTFTKISNAITIAVRSGGGASAIEKAREANMPKENIERAIAKAKGGEGKIVEEVVYEGFVTGGVSVIVEAVTDNSLRTTSEIKSIFRKVGASFGQPGSVAYQFVSKGMIGIKKNGKSLDEIFNLAVESGAEDFQEDVGGDVVVYTSPQDLSKVSSKLLELGLNLLDTEIVRKPVQTITIADSKQREKIINFLQKLEDLDDVQKVYSNLA